MITRLGTVPIDEKCQRILSVKSGGPPLREEEVSERMKDREVRGQETRGTSVEDKGNDPKELGKGRGHGFCSHP